MQPPSPPVLRQSNRRRLAAFFVATGIVTASAVAQPGSTDAAFTVPFEPGLPRQVNAITELPNGNFLLGGTFTMRGPDLAFRNSLAQIDRTGSVVAFHAGSGADGTVRTVVVQPDGKILIGGDFARFNGRPHPGIVRLHASGAVDLNFVLAIRGAPAVWTIQVMADGRIVVGGSLERPSGTNRLQVVRLEPDGSVDATFAAPSDLGPEVRAIVIQRDGRLVVAGPGMVARLLPGGQVDPEFQRSTPGGDVNAVTLQADGRVIVGGDFVRTAEFPYQRLARLHPDGRPDPTLGHAPLAAVWALARQADGHVLLAGEFGYIDRRYSPGVARLLSDGAWDDAFQATDGNLADARCVSIATNGTILVGGTFGVVRLRGGPLSAPTFYSEPMGTQAFSGQSARLTSEVLALPAPTLQWWKDGVLLPRATNDTFEIPVARLADSGDYWLVASNAVGVATSAVARLSVIAPEPAILSAPGEVTVQIGSSAGFVVEVQGQPPLFLQWTRDGRVLPEATNSTLAIPFVVTADQGTYTVIVTNAFGAITSAPVELRVITNAPVFVLQPTNASRTVGQTFSLTATATGIPPPRLQWQLGGIELTGETNETLTFRAIREDHAGPYRVIATSVAGVATSAVALVTVDPTVLLIGQLTNQSTAEGRTVNFVATAFGRPPLSAQWFLNDQPLTGATQATLSLPSVRLADAGRYHLVVTNEISRITSPTVTLVVRPARTNAGAVALDFSADVEPATGLNPALAVQPDGRILVGGEFDRIGGVPRHNIARLLPNGQVDPTFDPGLGPDGRISSIALAADGKILIGGSFTNVGGVPRRLVARLNTDGTLDPSFAPDLSPIPAFETINSVAVQRSGHVVVAGSGRTVARFRPDGTPGGRFIFPDLNPSVPGSPLNNFRILAVLADDSVVLTYSRHEGGLLLLHPSGIWDFSFTDSPLQSGFSLRGPTTVVELPDRRLLVSGDYFRLRDGIVTAENGVVRLLPNGRLDESSSPLPVRGSVSSFVVQNDGKILIAGLFDAINGVPRKGIARLYANGTLDPSFDPGAGLSGLSLNGQRPSVRLLPDCRVLVAGTFFAVDDVSRTNLAVLLNDSGGPPVITVPPTDQTVAAGQDTFFQVGTPGVFLSFQWWRDGIPIPDATNALVRLRHVLPERDPGTYSVIVSNALGVVTSAPVTLTVLADPKHAGWPDASFDPGLGADDRVRAIARQSDGRVVLGGYFSSFNGRPRRGVVRLLPDGQVDESFNPGRGLDDNPLSRVEVIAIQGDGKILIGGAFTNVGGVVRPNLARLEANGTVDLTFDPGEGPFGPNAVVYALAPQPEGRWLVGGSFQRFGPSDRAYLVRIDANGHLDPTLGDGQVFGPGFPPIVGTAAYSLAPLPDGKILVGQFQAVSLLLGDGTRFGDSLFRFPPGAVANSIVPVEDGTIWVAGGMGPISFSSALFRLKPNLQFDSLVAGASSATEDFQSLIRDECGRLLAGGLFRPSRTNELISVGQLGPDAHFDLTFDAGVPDGKVFKMTLAPGGGVYVVGDFFRFRGVRCPGVARLHAPAVAPVIDEPPRDRGTAAGVAVILAPVLTNCPRPFFQWLFDGIPIVNATNPTLTFANPSPTNQGLYSVVASNYLGSVTSAPSRLTVARSQIEAGKLDMDFFPGAGADAPVRALGLQSDGKLLIGGGFTNVLGTRRDWVARLGWDGSLDRTFALTNRLLTEVGRRSDEIAGIRIDRLGRILVTGYFQDPVDRVVGILRLLPNGSRDPSFRQPDLRHPRVVTPALAQTDGGIVFDSFHHHLVRCLENGDFDPSFRPQLEGRVFGQGQAYGITRQLDGRYVIGGSFYAVRLGTNLILRPGLARLHSDGSPDLSFDPGAGADQEVRWIAQLPDSRFLIGGFFTTVDGHASARVARLEANGSVDRSFRTPSLLSGTANAFAVDGHGRVYVGGSFTIPGSVFSNFPAIDRKHLIRLLPDGGLDPTFDPVIGPNGAVHALALDGYGGLYLGGAFTTYMTVPRPRVARVHTGVLAAQPAHARDTLSVNVMTTVGWTYHLERSDTLPAMIWRHVATTPGNGSVQRLSDPAANSGSSYYRVRVE